MSNARLAAALARCTREALQIRVVDLPLAVIADYVPIAAATVHPLVEIVAVSRHVHVVRLDAFSVQVSTG